MEIYYKNLSAQTKQQADQLLSDMDNFVSSGSGGQPRLDAQLTKIWNQGGKRLDWQWSEETQQEIEQKEQSTQSETDKITAYKNDLELWKNEKVRPWRNWAISAWIDSVRDHGEMWEEQTEEVKAELKAKRIELKDWPATFTKYVTDQTIEDRKPVKPSYI